MKRPVSIGDGVLYERSLDAEPILRGHAAGAISDDPVRGGEILESLYGPRARPVQIEVPGELDATIFAVWSQQWPRLRRNFRFQTAAMRETTVRSGTRFDLQLDLGSAKREFPSNENWVLAAQTDLANSAGGAFRSFIWRYGQDVKKQRGSFRPLSELFVLDEQQASEAPAIYLPGLLEANFPEPDDAAIVKQDVVDGQIPPADAGSQSRP